MKKLLALLLAVTMVISMAACAPAEPAGTTTGEPKDTTAAKENTTVAATTTEPAVDMSATPFVEPGSVKLTIGIKSTATVLSYDENYLTKKLEELSGIDIEFVPFSSDTNEATQQLNLMIANKEKLPDILWNVVTTDAQASELGEAGILADLTPYWEEGYAYNADQRIALMSEAERSYFWARLVDGVTGEMYFFPGYKHGYSADEMTYIGGVNATMAKNVGMDANEIDTVAEVYEFLYKTVNEDGNGNGEKDEMGMVAPLNHSYRADLMQWIINAYVYCNDKYLWNATDGEVWTPYSTDEYRKALIELNKWYSEGLISPLTYSIQDRNEMRPLLAEGEDYEVCIFGDTPTLFTDANSTVAQDYVGIRVLQDETGKGGYNNWRDPYVMSKSVVITAGCEHIDLAFRFLDLFNREDVYHWARYGEEGVNWEHYDGKAENKQTANGDWADFAVLADEWSVESSLTWKANSIYFRTFDAIDAGLQCAGSWRNPDRSNRANVYFDSILDWEAHEAPAEVVYSLIYNAEESNTVNEYEKLYKEFMQEARAQFITGVLDPNNDADWEKYLEELEANGQSDLLEAAQSAYTRLNG